MLSGFQLNLQAMSLVSLLVGMFLIYNTIEASVVRRRHEIGILRSLGATRGKCAGSFLGEAAVLGAVRDRGRDGGRIFPGEKPCRHGRGNDFVALRPASACASSCVAPWTWMSALLLGLFSVLAAAWLPARAAAAMNPGRDAASRSARRASRAAFARLDCWRGRLVSARVRALLPRAAHRAAMARFWRGLLCSRRLLLHRAPVTARFSRFVRATFMRKKIEPWLAAQNLGRTLLRNSVTIASLAAAVAMTVGIAVMVFSFRQTVADWINQTLVADLFIGPAANEIAGPTSFVPPAGDRLFGKESGGRGGRHLPRDRLAVSRSDHRAGGHERPEPAQPAFLEGRQ